MICPPQTIAHLLVHPLVYTARCGIVVLVMFGSMLPKCLPLPAIAQGDSIHSVAQPEFFQRYKLKRHLEEQYFSRQRVLEQCVGQHSAQYVAEYAEYDSSGYGSNTIPIAPLFRKPNEHIAAAPDTSEFYSWDEFRYAGQRQYTIDGSLPRRWTELRMPAAAIVGSVYASVVAGLQIYQGINFWQDRVPFRVIDDWDIELFTDKPGHFFAAYIASKVSKDMLMAAGYSWELAAICGPIMGLGYQFYVEVMDGYGKNWGFSPSDAWFNAMGAGWLLAQHFVPFLQYIAPKADFIPSPWFGERTRRLSVNLLDDYSSWTWWLSINIYHFLPESMQQWYPPWLNIAVGYAARNLDWPDADRKFILSLDYDLEKLLPPADDTTAPVWNWLRHYLNLIKLPAPAVEFSSLRPPRFYLLYPFKIGASP
jgi:hypothetical protein